MKYLDLFAGYGGFSLGIKQAYEDRNNNAQENGGSEEDPKGADEVGERLLSVSNERTLYPMDGNMQHSDSIRGEGNPTCIGFCEIDKYATQVYKHKFPTHKEYGDITKRGASPCG